MNKGQLIGGIICLVVAVLLAVLIFTLPEGKVVFMVDDNNVPWIPVIVLAGAGAALVGTARRRQGT
jgi:peptidoglycan/LPS O-acetylase OafA/YrhL